MIICGRDGFRFASARRESFTICQPSRRQKEKFQKRIEGSDLGRSWKKLSEHPPSEGSTFQTSFEKAVILGTRLNYGFHRIQSDLNVRSC